MANNKFSKLNIDIDKAQEWIKFWCENNLEDSVEISRISKGNRISFTINHKDGDIMVDFIEATGKRYTISPKVGKRQEVSNNIAEYILECINNCSSVNTEMGNGFSIITNKETFENIIQLLDSDEEITQIERKVFDEEHKAQYMQYRYKSKYGDRVTIKFFNRTNRLQIQGKPLYLFCIIQDILITDDIAVEGIVDANIKYYSVDMKKEDLYTEMKCALGEELYGFLTSSLRAILSPAFLFYKVAMDLDNYSCLCQPALQSMEGYILKLLTTSGVIHNSEKLGEYYSFDEDTKKHYLKEEICAIINNSKRIDSLNMLYVLYNSKRHPYSHSTERNYDTRIISDRETADSIFREIIGAMKSSYENWR